MIVNLININDKTLWWQVEREKFDENIFVTITDEQYNSLKEIESKYIIFDDVEGIKVPREMTMEEKQSYDQNNQPIPEKKNPLDVLKSLSEITTQEDGMAIANAKLQPPFNIFTDTVLAGDFDTAKGIAQEAFISGLISQELLDKIISVLS